MNTPAVNASNVNRADAILNLPEPWATPFGHLDDDAKEKPSLDSILGNFPAGTFALDKKEEEAVVLDVPWDVPAGATNS